MKLEDTEEAQPLQDYRGLLPGYLVSLRVKSHDGWTGEKSAEKEGKVLYPKGSITITFLHASKMNQGDCP